MCRRLDVPRSERQPGALQHRRAAENDAATGRRASASTGTSTGDQRDAGARRHGRVHGQAAVRLDLEPDRQHRRARRLHPGDEHDGVPVQPEPGQVQAGARPAAPPPATSSTSPTGLPFPQTWRTNIGVDRRLPWGLVGTGEYIYNRDVNGIGLHQRQPAGARSTSSASTTGRWTARPALATVEPDQQRRGQPDHREHRAARTRASADSWNSSAGSVAKPVEPRLRIQGRLQLRRVEEHGRAGLDRRRLVDGQPDRHRSEQPAARLLEPTRPAPRFFFAPSYTHQYFGFGATTICGVLGYARQHHQLSATPATSSRATRTATRRRPTT